MTIVLGGLAQAQVRPDTLADRLVSAFNSPVLRRAGDMGSITTVS